MKAGSVEIMDGNLNRVHVQLDCDSPVLGRTGCRPEELMVDEFLWH